MNTTAESGRALAAGVRRALGGQDVVDVAVLPPSVYLTTILEALAGSSIRVGAQNMYFEDRGAFTGEISASMIRDIGCDYVLLGHSERRHVFGESDEWINRKVLQALGNGVKVIFAVGELREAGRTLEVNRRQVRIGLEGVDAAAMANLTVAYEPVWAIGTGKTATPDEAQEVHAMIRAQLEEMYGASVARAVRIQYGGSVKPDNAAELFAQPDIDGGLIGGASLNVDDFAAIVNAGV
jgi:triosephosphate isomerase